MGFEEEDRLIARYQAWKEKKSGTKLDYYSATTTPMELMSPL